MEELQDIVCRDKKVATDLSINELQEVVKDHEAVIWIDIHGDADHYKELLSETFGLSKLAIESIDEDEKRARFTEAANYNHITIHGLAYDRKLDEASMPELDIIFGQNFLITVHRPDFSCLAELRRDVLAKDEDEHPMSKGIGFLLYHLLDRLVDSYFPVLDDIDDVIDDLEDITVSDTSNDVQVRIFRIKRSLAQMRRVISPQVELANTLRVRATRFIAPEVGPYLSEVYDHLIRAFEVLDSYRDLMSGLLDVYLTTVSNRLNVIMKQLTLIATIFMPITFITGIFGQNFGHSPQVDHDAGYNFWIVLLVMVIITVAQFWYFKKRKWI